MTWISCHLPPREPLIPGPQWAQEYKPGGRHLAAIPTHMFSRRLTSWGAIMDFPPLRSLVGHTCPKMIRLSIATYARLPNYVHHQMGHLHCGFVVLFVYPP